MVICSSNTYCLGYFVYFVLCCSAATVQREALCDFRCRHRHSLVQCIWTSCTHVFLFILDMWALFLLRLQPPKRNEWVWVIALLKFTFSIYQISRQKRREKSSAISENFCLFNALCWLYKHGSANNGTICQPKIFETIWQVILCVSKFY